MVIKPGTLDKLPGLIEALASSPGGHPGGPASLLPALASALLAGGTPVAGVEASTHTFHAHIAHARALAQAVRTLEPPMRPAGPPPSLTSPRRLRFHTQLSYPGRLRLESARSLDYADRFVHFYLWHMQPEEEGSDDEVDGAVASGTLNSM